MATLTKGTTFASGDVVTPAKLNNLVDLATVTNIQTADIADSQITTSKIADGAVTQSKLNASVTLVPTGAVMPFAMNSAPSGWLAANGAAVSRTTYATLFAAVGTTYGTGDGSTTFNLPDLRGIFVRGSGSQVIGSTTYNKTFASKENDAVGPHTHNYAYALATSITITGENSWPGVRPDYNLVNGVYPLSGGSTSTSSQSPAGTTETRPANIALLYCIKF